METSRIKKLTEKIQKLLALSQNAGATENERATALKFANGLMDKYSISLLDAETFENDPRERSSVLIGSHPWKATVYDAIGKMYGCLVWRTKGATGHVFVVGTESIRNVVLLMGDYVVESIEREVRCISTSGKRASTSFKVGASSGVHAQVSAIIRERDKGNDELPASKALVLASFYETEKEKNNEFFETLGMKLTKSPRRTISDAEAFAQGKSYGKRVSLNNQLGNGSNTPRLA